MSARPYTRINVEPNTPEWHEERRRSVGASDVPAVLGLNSYGRTPRTVYRAKKGIVDDFDPILSYVGHASEDIIAGWVSRFAADEYPEHADELRVAALGPGFMARSTDAKWLHATFDRTSSWEGQLIPWQFKTAHQFTAHKWDEGIPVDVEAQVMTEIFVAGAPHGYVVVWIGGRTFKLYRVERNDPWIDNYLIPRTTEFWDHVYRGVEPPPITREEIAEAYPSQPKAIEALPDVVAWVEQRDVLLSDRRDIDAELEPIEVAIATYMTDHDTLTDQGRPILTYKSQSGRRTVDYNALYADFPAAYAATVGRGRDFKVFRRIKPKDES